MDSLLHQLFPQGIDTTAERQLNRLPQPMRPLLVAAAVAGRTVDSVLLNQLICQKNYAFTFDEWLIHSVSAAILEIGNGQTRFVSEKLRLMLLEALSQDESKLWREQIVAALESILPDSPAHAAALANHWQQLNDSQQEQRYARLAGAYAYQQYDYETAVHYLSRAFHLTPEDDLAEQYHLLLARELAYHAQGARDAQKDDLTRLAEIADHLTKETGQEWRTAVALRLGAFAAITGEYTVAIVAATEALHWAEITNTPAHKAASNLLWGKALLRQGKYEETQQKLQLSLTQARQHQLPQVEADSLRFLGVCAADMGQFDLARQQYEAALPLYRELQDKRGESTVLNNLSIVSYSQNQLVAAMAHWEEARQIHVSIGDKEGTARVLSNLSSVCMDLGEYEKGRTFSLEALTICRATDIRFGQGMNLINLSLFNFYLGEGQQADIHSCAALELARDMKSLPLEGLALKDRAYLLLQQQQWPAAEQIYQQATAVWEELSQTLQLLEAQAGLAKAALAQQKLAQAVEYIQPLVAHLQAEQTFSGTSRPFFIYLVLYEVLSAAEDAYAVDVLQQAYKHLTLFANEIVEPAQQQMFFQNVAEHRQLQAHYLQLASSA